MTKTRLALLIIAITGAVLWYRHAPGVKQEPRPADGVLVGAEPRWGAASVGKYASYTQLGANESIPTGAYDVTGRVLARRSYPASGFSEQITLELVLGWGPMSDNRVLDHLSISQEDRTMRIDPRAGLALELDAAYAAAINISVYSDFDEHRAALESVKVGDVIHMIGWTLRLRNSQGETWQGGAGFDQNPRRTVVLQVLKLQINDEKKFGNWSVETNEFPPQ
jgi:hypothetical protein